MTADPGLTIAMAKRIELWPVDRLQPYERNARTHSPEQVAQIAASIVEFGFTNPILVDSNDGIIAGHGRLTAAQELGLRTVPVVVLDHLSDRQRKAYILADNQLALNAGWDTDLLRGELQDLAEQDFDLSLIGFSDDELADLLPEVEELPPEDADSDAVPEAPEEPITKLGDVWLLGKHRVMCGDSTSLHEVERLMAGAKADMVFTDPPYGVAYEGGHNDKKRQQIQNDALEGEDLTSLFYGALITAVTVTEDYAPFYVWFASGKSVETFAAFAQLPLKLRAVIQWYKVRSGLGAFMSQYIPNCEPCMYAYKSGCSPQWFGPTDEKTVWELQKESRNEFHPTQKPVELPERAITNSSKKGQLVLDLFGGSGSTLIACEKTGRQARLMELDPRYCDVIVKRWQQFSGKTAKLDGSGEPFPADA
jgi:ParB-like chromosome segregation protein Spo0J